LNQPVIQDSAARESEKISAIPGLHIVANFHAPEFKKLSAFENFRMFIDHEIQKFNLTKVGEVYHNFPGGGFTGVVCLTESHLSIHTWPEKNYVTFDIFLSNYLKDNRTTTHSIYEKVKIFFEADVVYEQILER
jgi:S-adenosylmethionine decarboxylase